MTARPVPGWLPAVFMRGGTSKALMLHRRDLPGDLAAWEPTFLSAMDSPDPFGRQLNGMGGGVSSVSKVCVVERLGAAGRRHRLHLRAGGGPRGPRSTIAAIAATCSRRSGRSPSTRGSWRSPTAPCIVRIYNTNTRKLIAASFAARGRPDRLPRRPRDPRRHRHRRTDPPRLPRSGRRHHRPAAAHRRRPPSLDVPGLGPIEVSLVDAANACVFVARRRSRPHRRRAARRPGGDARPPRPAGADPPGRLRRDGHRAGSRRGGAASSTCPSSASSRRRRTPAACPGADPRRGCRPDRPGDLQRRAAPGPAAHRHPVPRRRRPARGQPRPRVRAPHRRRRPAGRHAVGHPHRRRRRCRATANGWRAERGSFFRTARPLMRGDVFYDAPAPV